MELWANIWDSLVDRVSGPMKLRLIIQPTVAAVLGIRAGLADARVGRPPYFWAAIANKADRRELLRHGWKDITILFTVAMILDVVYQVIVLRWVYFVETLLVATLLAVVPYVVLRGPTNRIARLGRGKSAAHDDLKE